MEAVASEFKYSGAGLAFLLAAAVATIALLLVLPMGWGLRAACLFYVVAVAAHACRELTRFTALRLRIGRRLALRRDDGEWVEGEVLDDSFVVWWLVVVRWRAAGERRSRSLVLLPGMAPPDTLRKIRVIVRWG